MYDIRLKLRRAKEAVVNLHVFNACKTSNNSKGMFAVSSVTVAKDSSAGKNACLIRQAASSASLRRSIKRNMDGVSLVNGWLELLADAETMSLKLGPLRDSDHRSRLVGAWRRRGSKGPLCWSKMA